jgi:hypothetical protein
MARPASVAGAPGAVGDKGSAGFAPKPMEEHTAGCIPLSRPRPDRRVLEVDEIQ